MATFSSLAIASQGRDVTSVSAFVGARGWPKLTGARALPSLRVQFSLVLGSYQSDLTPHSACSDWTPKVVRLELLVLEFVKKTQEFALSRFNDCAAVLPDGIFDVVASTNRITLILVDIVDTQALAKRLPKNIESDALRKRQGFR